MSVVNTRVPITSASCEEMILGLVEKYPFCRTEILTRTVFQRPVRTLVIGQGQRKVLYTAAHHANEWITALVLLQFVEDLAAAYSENSSVFGIPAQEILSTATIYTVPMVNPDGVDLVVGQTDGTQTAVARTLTANYPQIPFPAGWKANLVGVDLNLQYPAGWLTAREIKFSQGYTAPGPRDYVGRAPLSQPETRALAGYTEYIDPALILAYHTQGQEIYWKFRDYQVPGAKALGQEFARVSGYDLSDTPYASGFAGYKDWFIERFRRPGYTIEAGLGENPLPLTQFPEIYRDNIGILALAALG